MMTGRIHSFQSFGTVDGPGVRCVVFLQGCPLRCSCCHNPDTWDFGGGEEISVDTLVEKILRLRNYFGKTGGVTLSGGEPLMQATFATELFKKLKAFEIHTALDTSGCLWNSDVETLLLYTDLVLLDDKYPSNNEYLLRVGCERSAMEHFLEETERRGIPVWLRRVIIHGLNHSEEATLQLREERDRFSCIQKIELLPFRKLCMEKYKALDIPFPFETLPETTPEEIAVLEKILFST